MSLGADRAAASDQFLEIIKASRRHRQMMVTIAERRRAVSHITKS
jgi:hypothetical protein